MLFVMLILVFLGAAYLLYKYSNKLLKKEINLISDEKLSFNNKLNTLMDELRSIDIFEFKIVPGHILYPKTWGVILKFIAGMSIIALLTLIVDYGLHSLIFVHKSLGDIGICAFAYAFVVCCFSSIALGGVVWKYNFFKYGLVSKINHAEVADEVLTYYVKKIIKNYFIVSCASFFVGTIFLGNGFCMYVIASIVYQIATLIYFNMEIERIGFAPIFNYISKKLDASKAVRENAPWHGKNVL